MCFSDEEQIEVHSDIKGKISDYDILKNVPTIDGVPVHGDITESGKYTDETPTAGSKKLITSGAMRAAMERGDLKGPKGDDGYSPRIEVVNIGSGYRVKITDIDGTKYFDVICGENAPGTHTHDERYYTEAETDELISRVQNNATLLISDLSAQTDEKLSGKSDTGHVHDDLYYTEAETENLISEAESRSQILVSDLSAQIDTKLSVKSNKNHTHDDVYCSKAETAALISDAKTEVLVDTQGLVINLEAQTEEKLSGKSNTGHTHDDRYYTDGEVDALLADKSDTSHTHDGRYYTETEVDTKLSGKSDTNHTHDDRYYTETETDELITQAQNNAMLLISDLSAQTDEKLSGKSDISHNHDNTYPTKSQVTNAIASTTSELSAGIEELLAGKSDSEHTHDGRYYTESEVNNLLSGKSDTGHTHWFLTAYGGSNTIMLNSNGNMYPLNDNTQDIGMYFDSGGRKYFKTINCYSINEVSDMRLKDKIDTNLEAYVNMLDLITPTSYMLKPDMEKGVYKRNVGYLAQEIQTALHNVGLKDDDFGALFYNAEIEKKGGESYGLNYSQFIPILHAKIKQIEEKYNAKIDEYDKKIAELEEKLAMYLSSN